MFQPGSIPLPALEQLALQLPLPQSLLAPNQLKFADVLLNVHAYWKSKVLEVHSRWKKLPNSFNIDELDKSNPSVEKSFENYTVPTLKLGNRVRIVSNMEKRLFKALHKKVGIWKENLTKLIEKEAIVMDLSSQFVIGVRMIENGESVYLHGFVLEFVGKDVNEGMWENTTDFKVDDEVVIGVEVGVLAHLQRPWLRTPIQVAAQLNGIIGRVMGCFTGGVVVTFDERTYEILSPAALVLHTSRNGKKKALPRTPGVPDIPKGSKVKVHPNVTEVMQNQFGHGEWNYKMTKFIGKEGTVADNVEGGDVIVNFSPLESYRMNRNSLVVMKKRNRAKQRSGNETPTDLLKPFAVGDIVRLNIGSDDLQSNLQLLRIPMEFLMMGGSCGEFVGYMNQNRGVVDFGDGTEFIFEIQLLTKVGSVMAEVFKKLRKRDKAIGVGAKVMLWIGSATFVEKCLATYKPGFENAMKEEATVVGYDDVGNAVVKHSDGNLYLVPDEYLCAPREIWKTVDIKRLEWEREPTEGPRAVSALEATILHSVTEVLKANGETSALGWKSLFKKVKDKEDVTEIEITFPGQIEDFERFIERLKSKLATENVRPELQKGGLVIFSRGLVHAIKFRFESEGEAKDLEMKSPQAQPEEAQKLGESSFRAPPALDRTASITEPIAAENLAIPTTQGRGVCNIPIPPGVAQVVLQIGSNPQARPAPLPPGPVPPQGTTQESGIIVNPQTTINMFGEGRNQLNIQRSYVREVNAE